MSALQLIHLSQWAPVGETSYDIYVERTAFVGLHLGSIAYGVQATVAFLTIKALLPLRNTRKLFFCAFSAYVFVIFSFATFGNASDIRGAQLGFVDNRDYTGGPVAYLAEQGDFLPVGLAGYVVYILATWMQDGLLLYRFMVIFNWTFVLMVIPCLLYLLTIISSVLLLVQLFGDSALSSTSSINFAITYWSASITTTLLLTTLIVGKLMYMRYKLTRASGSFSSQRNPYLSISSILIDSALLYSLFAVVFLVLFVRNDPFQNIVFTALGQVQIMAPQLIILRAAQGRSYTSSTMRSSAASKAYGVHVEIPLTSRTTAAGTSAMMFALDSRQESSRDGGEGFQSEFDKGSIAMA